MLSGPCVSSGTIKREREVKERRRWTVWSLTTAQSELNMTRLLSEFELVAITRFKSLCRHLLLLNLTGLFSQFTETHTPKRRHLGGNQRSVRMENTWKKGCLLGWNYPLGGSTVSEVTYMHSGCTLIMAVNRKWELTGAPPLKSHCPLILSLLE